MTTILRPTIALLALAAAVVVGWWWRRRGKDVARGGPVVAPQRWTDEDGCALVVPMAAWGLPEWEYDGGILGSRISSRYTVPFSRN